jgi:hypothetical protein
MKEENIQFEKPFVLVTAVTETFSNPNRVLSGSLPRQFNVEH